MTGGDAKVNKEAVKIGGYEAISSGKKDIFLQAFGVNFGSS